MLSPILILAGIDAAHEVRIGNLAIANQPSENGMKYDLCNRRSGELITLPEEERAVAPESRAGVPTAFMVKSQVFLLTLFTC
jgi:hypothetical protein